MAGVAKEFNSKFYFILVNLNVSVHVARGYCFGWHGLKHYSLGFFFHSLSMSEMTSFICLPTY